MLAEEASWNAPVLKRDSTSTGPRVAGPLEGLEVAVLGRLASMSRAEAFERIDAAGGRSVAEPTARTSLLVLGGEEMPLSDDGELTQPLAEARERIEAGSPLELVSEQEFLERLGLGEHGARLRRLYTSAQLARILDVPARRLRSWIRAGLIRPAKIVRRLAFFEFRQVAAAKALSRLTARGVTTRKLRASLEQLSRWWPEAKTALGQLAALEDGELLVRTPAGALAETSGQLRLDFSDQERSAPELEGTEKHAAAQAVPDAELWFQRALRLEEAERTEEAVQAYARALDPARPRPEVAFNLGNALYALERWEEAASAFTLATEVDPEYVEAWNNLGNALSALSRHEEARASFERALEQEPEYADAHFNMGETLAALGELDAARAHWRRYLTFDPSSIWAAEVRSRLRRTDPGLRPAGSLSTEATLPSARGLPSED